MREAKINHTENKGISEETDQAYIEPTKEMLRVWHWNRSATEKTRIEWRRRIRSSVDLIEKNLTILGSSVWDGSAPFKDWDFPNANDRKRIVNGLLRKRDEHGAAANPKDQNHLAYWFGLAMAFAHQHLNSEEDQRSYAAPSTYEILDLLMEEVSSLAFVGRTMPNWVGDQFLYIRRGSCLVDQSIYRPWPEIHEMLRIVLRTFLTHSLHEKDKGNPGIETHQAVRGTLALRLLAGDDSERISEEVYNGLTKLDANIFSSIFATEDGLLLRQRILSNWERHVFERTVLSVETEIGPTSEEVIIPSVKRRRTL